MSLHPLTAKFIDDLGAAMQAGADRIARLEETNAALNARLERANAAYTELEVKLIESRPLRLRYDAENAVLEACRALPESTLAFWRATRHIAGFDPAIEFIDAVVALRALEEEKP